MKSNMMNNDTTIPTVAELVQAGRTPDILFWVGCAGSYDERAQRISKSLCKILNHVGLNFAILGNEESCSGDPAKRAGNEFLFQMQALSNIQVLNNYGITKIVTACPHCFNTLKNEYPELGGCFEVIHHSQLISDLIREGRLRSVDGLSFKGKRITFHDPCYLGRANGVYEAPRQVLEALDADLIEMKRCKSNGLCCGAGGAQLFKEAEKGKKEINMERAEEAMQIKADIIATSCPFCMTMLRDGVKHLDQDDTVQVLDVAQLTAKANGLTDEP